MCGPPPLPDDHSNKARKDKMIRGGALGVEKGSLEKVSKLCSGLSKWTSISGHLTLIVPVRVCMHARVCVYVCVYNGYERLHSQRERSRKRGSNPSTEHNIRLRTDNERLEGSGKERKACLPRISAPSAASQSALHLTLTHSYTHT